MLQRKFALIKRKLESYSIDDLTDVSIGTPTNGEVLVWNGSSFVPGDHGDVAGLADDDHPQYAGIAQTETISGNWTFTGNVTFNTGDVSLAGPTYVDYGYLEIKSAGYAGLWFWNTSAAANEGWWGIDTTGSGNEVALRITNDSPTYTYKNILAWTRTGNALDRITYGNSTDSPGHTFYGYPSFYSAGMDIVSVAGWGIYLQDQSAPADTEWWSIESIGGTGTWRLFASNDAFSTQRDALRFTRTAGAVTGQLYGNSTDLPPHTFYGDVFTTNGGVSISESAANPALYFKTVTGYAGDIQLQYNGTLTALIRWEPTTNTLEFYDRNPSPVVTAVFDFDTGDLQCDGYVWASGEQKNAIVAGNLGSPTMPFSSSSDVDVGITAQSVTAGDQVGFYAYMEDGSRQWRCFFGLHDNDAWGMLMTGASIAASTPFKVQVASTSLLEADYQGAVRLYYNNSTKLATQTSGVTITGEIEMGSGGPKWLTGSGSPESAVTAPVGSLYTDTAGGTGTTLYVKESGTGNTGWVAK